MAKAIAELEATTRLNFAVALGVHYLPLPWRVRKFNLVVASSLFYAAWNPLYLLLLWISICVDWHIATRMVRFQATTRKRLLLVSLVVNLGMLCVFKYGNFLSENAAAFASLLGLHYDPEPARPDLASRHFVLHFRDPVHTRSTPIAASRCGLPFLTSCCS